MTQATDTHRAAVQAPSEMAGCPIMGNYGPPSIRFDRGAGTELWDGDGKRYLDFLTGLAVNSLGHAHPAVVAAITEQAGTLDHVSNLFSTKPMADLAVGIDGLLGGGGQVFFANSGTEVNEAGIKLARRWGGGEHGRHVVLSAFGSFHGRTMAALAATGQPQKHEPFAPMLPGFRYAEWGDVSDLERQIDEHTAAILLEPIQGEGGVNVPPDGYLAEVRELCNTHGVLLMLDEVQAGLGRTGQWFGFEHDLGDPRTDPALRPDVVMLAKALGNGMPIGALWARTEIAQAFKPGDHGSTFGGNPIACAAALAVLDVMHTIDAPRLALEKGAMLSGGLGSIDGIASVRGRGLLVAAEIDPDLLGDRTAKDVYTACLDRGLVTNAVSPTALRMAPPLTVSEDEIDEALAIIAEAVATLGGGS
jgi:predicted acetylornithine/succinylornithine family transaminase